MLHPAGKFRRKLSTGNRLSPGKQVTDRFSLVHVRCGATDFFRQDGCIADDEKIAVALSRMQFPALGYRHAAEQCGSPVPIRTVCSKIVQDDAAAGSPDGHKIAAKSQIAAVQYNASGHGFARRTTTRIMLHGVITEQSEHAGQAFDRQTRKDGPYPAAMSVPGKQIECRHVCTGQGRASSEFRQGNVGSTIKDDVENFHSGLLCCILSCCQGYKTRGIRLSAHEAGPDGCCGVYGIAIQAAMQAGIVHADIPTGSTAAEFAL